MRNNSLRPYHFKNFQSKLMALTLFLPLISFSANTGADGPSSKLINYNGKIGQNESHYDVRVEFWINNKNPHPNQDCHDLDAGRVCNYNSYGIGMRVYNNHSHAIKLDLKESLIFSQFPPTACEAQIQWVDERGAQKQYRIAPGGFTIDPYTYLGIGGIASMLGSSPACLYQDREWEAVGYNVNLYWKEIIPPPPKQPPKQTPVQQPPPSQPPVQQPPEQQPPPSSQPPVPDPAVMQRQMDELDRIGQRLNEIAMRMMSDSGDYGDAAYCRDTTEILTAYRDIINQIGDATMAEALRPVLTMYEQTRTEACDRSNWTSTGGSDDAADCADTWDYLSDNPSGKGWCSKAEPVMDNIAKPAAGPSSGSDGSNFGKAKLKEPCQRGVAGCQD